MSSAPYSSRRKFPDEDQTTEKTGLSATGTSIAFRLIPGLCLAFEATRVSAYLRETRSQSDECKGKLVIDGSRNQTRQHDQLLLLTRVVQRAEINADDDLNNGLEIETPGKNGETFGLTATINRNAKYNVMTKNFGVTPFSENKPPYSNVGKLNRKAANLEQQAHH